MKLVPRLLLLGLAALMLVWLGGCSGGGNPALGFEETNRLLDACKGVEYVPARDPGDPLDTLPGPMIPSEQATDELAAAVVYRQFYCSCVVKTASGGTADARTAYVSDPPESTRSDCESGAYEGMATQELGEFLPDDPLGYLETNPPGSTPTTATGS